MATTVMSFGVMRGCARKAGAVWVAVFVDIFFSPYCRSGIPGCSVNYTGYYNFFQKKRQAGKRKTSFQGFLSCLSTSTMNASK
jgi:hypothetical protein